ncbi:hypothetical protein RclHR1_06260029 [Rhizophagus clarus]|uniref:Uncharacterized protein n=1 Tax=Rhizophagus clarus TaxID=94130 RepID=A0A2Z6RXA6_9GLOM|nr:hypothetical protein RclHR1_06260029 [Rhizophagus clarus]
MPVIVLYPVITYFDSSLLRSSIKLACARQLKRHTRRIFLLDSISPALWDDFSAHINAAYNVPPLLLPLGISTGYNFKRIFDILSHSSSLLRGLHLLKEKEYQDLSIKSHIEKRDLNFDTDISSFINLALSRSRQRIVLDRVFIDHPTAPRLLTDPLDISDAVVTHFQNAIPVKSTPPLHLSALPIDGDLSIHPWIQFHL